MTAVTRQPPEIQAPALVETLATGSTLLTDLQRDWMSTEQAGREWTLSQAKIESSISMLSQMKQVGTPSQVIDVIRRYLTHDPRNSTVPDTLAEDWFRHLAPYPIAAIFAVYDKEIAAPGKWLLSLGDFIDKVKSWSMAIDRMLLRLERMEADAIRTQETAA